MKRIIIILILASIISQTFAQDNNIINLIIDTLIRKEINSQDYYLYEIKVNTYNIQTRNEEYFIEKLRLDFSDTTLRDLIQIVYKQRENYIEQTWTLKEFPDAILMSQKKIQKHVEKYFLTQYAYNKFDSRHDYITYIDTLTGELKTDTIRTTKKKIIKEPIPKNKFRIFFISEIVYNSTNDIAIVDWGYNPYTLQGYGCTLIFVREKDKWIYLGKYLTWAS